MSEGRLPEHLVPVVAPMVSGWVRVVTGSMAPVLRPGDEVWLSPGVPVVGAIILVPHDGQFLLHRLLRRDAAGLWLGGDATASWEGPFADQAWPLAVRWRRAGVESPLSDRWWERWLARLAPALVSLPLPGGRRGLARLLRELAHHRGA